MNSRELVTRAITFERPDRVLLLFRCDPNRSDLVCVGFSTPTGWTPAYQEADEWGCVWANIIGTGLGQVAKHPLENASDLGGYPFPDPHAPGRFDGVSDAARIFDGKYIAGNMGMSGFNLMMSLRGFENILMDIAVSTAFLTEIVDAVWDFEAGLIEEYAARGVHGVWFFDDWGTENSLFIRPAAWREIFKPRYREQFGKAHNRGMHVFFHSCGYVWDILGDLIELGVDVINLEQPNVFDAEGISGVDRLAASFCTNPDGQRILAHASPSEVEEEVKHIIAAFSGFGGGLIALADCGKDHNILPPANIASMEAAFTRFGR